MIIGTRDDRYVEAYATTLDSLEMRHEDNAYVPVTGLYVLKLSKAILSSAPTIF